MKYMQCWLLFLFSILSFTVFASANSEAFTNTLNGIRNVQANFTQSIYDNKNKVLQKSVGKMAMERSGNFRWEVTKPTPQLIVANKNRLWIYDPDLQQVTIRSLKKVAGETPALLLTQNNAEIDQNYQVNIGNKAGMDEWFELIPKRKDHMFLSIQMGFKNKVIAEMRLKDNLGHTTAIVFQNVKVNQNLSPSLFNFKPPASADVINETQ